jgi:hypothetical protein
MPIMRMPIARNADRENADHENADHENADRGNALSWFTATTPLPCNNSLNAVPTFFTHKKERPECL